MVIRGFPPAWPEVPNWLPATGIVTGRPPTHNMKHATI